MHETYLNIGLLSIKHFKHFYLNDSSNEFDY